MIEKRIVCLFRGLQLCHIFENLHNCCVISNTHGVNDHCSLVSTKHCAISEAFQNLQLNTRFSGGLFALSITFSVCLLHVRTYQLFMKAARQT